MFSGERAANVAGLLLHARRGARRRSPGFACSSSRPRLTLRHDPDFANAKHISRQTLGAIGATQAAWIARYSHRSAPPATLENFAHFDNGVGYGTRGGAGSMSEVDWPVAREGRRLGRRGRRAVRRLPWPPGSPPSLSVRLNPPAGS